VAMTRARDTLLLTAFDGGRRGAAPWPSGVTGELVERELLSARSYWDWLRLWLGTVTQPGEWTSETSGQNALLSWRRVASADLSGPGTALDITSVDPSGVPSFDLEGLRARLAWRNPWPAAATEAAKSNVTVLRRRAKDDDAEARVLFRARHAPTVGLSAADIGSAHHTFLQYVSLERTGSLLDLRNEAERLSHNGHLSRAEVDALNYEALLRFWLSPAGRRVVRASAQVHRELPFTARFTAAELRAMRIPAADAAPDDFIVVQGVIDLAVIRDEGILLLDFKTDVFRPDALGEKRREYEPQLRLYASALAQIYGLPVTEAALHFLSMGQTLPISVN